MKRKRVPQLPTLFHEALALLDTVSYPEALKKLPFMDRHPNLKRREAGSKAVGAVLGRTLGDRANRVRLPESKISDPPLPSLIHAQEGSVPEAEPLPESQIGSCAGAVVMLTRTEGKRTVRVRVQGFDAADAALRQWSEIDPGSGAAQGCDFIVRFADGVVSAGTYLLQSGTPPDLCRHIRRSWSFLAGRDPGWATPEEYARILDSNERFSPGMAARYGALLDHHDPEKGEES